jgi:DNA-binding SARP family transcriptional activator
MGPGGLRRLAGCYAVLRPGPPLPAWPALGAMSGASLAALAAPCDALVLDNVAAMVQERYAAVAWIRLGAADADPGALLLTLLGALGRLDAAASAGIAEAAARQGRRGDWEHAYRLLSATLGAVTEQPAVVVLEGAEHLGRERAARLDLLGSVLLPALQENLDILLISYTDWDRRRLGPHALVLGPRQLRLDPSAAALVADTLHVSLSQAALRRMVAITGGAAGASRAALSASAVTGREAFAAAVAAAPSGTELLARLGRGMLVRASEDTRIALAGALRLGVWHPSMGTALGHSSVRWDEDWWLDLSEGWKQLVPAWRAPLRSIGVAAALDSASLTLLADHLAGHGVTDRAVDLYLEAGEPGRAADTAAGLAGDLAAGGCWPSLTRLGQDLASRTSAIQRRTDEGVAGQPTRRWWYRRPGGRRSGQGGPLAGPVSRPSDPPHPAVRAPASALQRAPGSASESAGRSAPAPPTIDPAIDAPRAVTVHLLGELQVVFGERPVGKWVSGRGRAVFEYLVVHRHSRVRRESLMNVFWPDAEPDAARNSLNVAIHGLRQSLRAAAGDHAVVIYQDGSYFVEPALDIWVDVDAFEDRLKSARQHLTSDDPAAAQADFEAAIGLYQGEFLADDPYEQWAHVTREHLRLAYLDCLDQLGRLRFDAGDYSGCADLCRKLLACDNCREDTQRRLMRCHSRLGQPQLALRQYHSFVATLHTELHLPPAPTTTELAARIRRRSEV